MATIAATFSAFSCQIRTNLQPQSGNPRKKKEKCDVDLHRITSRMFPVALSGLGPLLCWDNWSFTSWKFLPTQSRLPRQPALPKCYGTLLLLTNHESASPICFTPSPRCRAHHSAGFGMRSASFSDGSSSVGLIVRLRPSFPVLSASA